MIKKNKIIFFGTPDFAVTSLDAIYSNFNIHSVVTHLTENLVEVKN